MHDLGERHDRRPPCPGFGRNRSKMRFSIWVGTPLGDRHDPAAALLRLLLIAPAIQTGNECRNVGQSAQNGAQDIAAPFPQARMT